MSIGYKQSGVDIDAGNEAVRRIKDKVKATFDKNVVTGLGTFGAMYDLSEVKQYKHPILVQSIDGVGTKLKVASLMKSYRSVGHDIVNHCCDDVLCQGARPFTFLDYVAAGKLKPEIIEEIVSGMAEACQAVDVNLIGGETAEMPGVYMEGEHDIVGCITGVVEKDDVITGDDIHVGDILIGFASSGLHTNGYSLARKLFFEVGNFKVDDTIPELGETVGEALIKSHVNYVNPVLGLIAGGIKVKGIAHLTGGGFIENIPRMLPADVGVEIQKSSWPVLPVFQVMQRLGDIGEMEMYRTFNMGIGLIVAITSEQQVAAESILSKYDKYQTYLVGRVISGEKKVNFI